MSVVRAPAKINVRLRIRARETTGWHQIEALNCRLALSDDIAIEPTPAGLALDVDGAELGSTHENLVWRAATRFFHTADLHPAVHIRLTKRVPAGAGLGGGSSDAAFTLLALNDLHGRPLTKIQLLDLGATLGSDIPFFLSQADFALVWGRGERVLPLPAPPSLPVVLVVPRERIATADAYARAAASRSVESGPDPAVLDHLLDASWDAVLPMAGNDFEPLADALIPALPAIRTALRNTGARLAQLTGTGSTMFAIFDDTTTARTAAASMAAVVPDAQIIETRTVCGESG